MASNKHPIRHAETPSHRANRRRRARTSRHQQASYQTHRNTEPPSEPPPTSTSNWASTSILLDVQRHRAAAANEHEQLGITHWVTYTEEQRSNKFEKRKCSCQEDHQSFHSCHLTTIHQVSNSRKLVYARTGKALGFRRAQCSGSKRTINLSKLQSLNIRFL